MIPIQAFIQDLGRHVALCSYSGVRWYVHLICITGKQGGGSKQYKIKHTGRVFNMHLGNVNWK